MERTVVQSLPATSALKKINAQLANSTSAQTTTLGPFAVTTTNAQFGGLWLLYLEVVFGIPSAAINEDVLLEDISGLTVFEWHINMGIAPANAGRIQLILPYPGLFSPSLSGVNQQWSLVTPATTSGPGYSVNMMGYVV